MVLPLPIDTPIPCLICAATTAASATTFSGTVSAASPGAFRVFDFTSRRIMTFTVPSDVHEAERAAPGLFARVTYTSSRGTNTAIKVLLLTGSQCRAMLASRRESDPKIRCPD
jgi:hypothetical protein